MSEREEWLQLEDYPIYEVSNLGRIRNIRLNRLLKPRKIWSGYYRVALYRYENNKRTIDEVLVHRATFLTFFPQEGQKVHRHPSEEYDEKIQIHHRNEDKRDNRLVNLMLVSAQYNTRQRSSNKIDLNKAREIRERYKRGEKQGQER